MKATAQVIPFQFEAQQVRTMLIDDQPWFVAADVCLALAVRNSRDALSRLDDDEKGVATTDTLGGSQAVGIVNESGLYSLVLTSRKAEAKRFKKWITAEVLPAIRKTGTYSTSTRRSKASREAAVWLTEAEAFNLAGLLGLLSYFEEVQQKAENVLRAAESPLASTMFDAWHETALFCGVLDHVRDRCKKVQVRMKATILK